MNNYQLLEALKDSFVKSYKVVNVTKTDYHKDSDINGTTHLYQWTGKMENGRLFTFGLVVEFVQFGRCEREIFVSIDENNKNIKHKRIPIHKHQMEVDAIKKLLLDNLKLRFQ